MGCFKGLLNKFAQKVHKNAVKHGWWETKRELPEILMLVVSELSEALEEHRNGKPNIYFVCPYHGYTEQMS